MRHVSVFTLLALSMVFLYGLHARADVTNLSQLANQTSVESQKAFANQARLLRSELTDDEKRQVLDDLYAGLLLNTESLGAAELSAVRYALLGASDLGMPIEQQLESVIRAINTSNQIGNATAEDLLFFVTMLGAAAGDNDTTPMTRAESRLVEVITGRIRSWASNPPDPKQVIQTTQLVGSAVAIADDTQRAEMASAILSAYSGMPDNSIVVTGPGSTHVQRMMEELRQPLVTQQLTASKVLDHANWKQSTPNQVAQLYAILTPPQDSTRAAAARGLILEHASADLAWFAEMGFRLSEEHAEAVDAELNTAFAELWQTQGPAMESMPVMTAGQALAVLRLGSGDSEGMPDLWWRVFQGRLESGKAIVGDYTEFESAGMMLMQPASIEKLRSVLEAPSGRASLEIAKLLSWAYTESEQLEEWRSTLRERSSNESQTADQRASWLLAAAYSEHTWPMSNRVLPGESLAQEAFGLAESESLRLEGLEWMTYLHLRLHDSAKALALIHSVKHQFEAAEMQARVQSLEARVTDSIQQDSVRATLLEAQEERRRNVNMLQSLERHREKQVTRGKSAEDIASIDAMMAQLRIEISGIEPESSE